MRTVAQLGGHNLAALAYLTEIAPGLGDSTGCRVLRDVIGETFTNTLAVGSGTVFYLGAVSRMLGELELGCGDHDAALAHLSEGLAVDSALGARPYVARGQLAMAPALRATGDLQHALGPARAAATEARRVDMPGLLRDAESLLADLAAAARAEYPLTTREREIAQLVAQALTNRDVATRLVLSERTVESHVRSILAKTGLRSRAELTRWFLRRQPP